MFTSSPNHSQIIYFWSWISHRLSLLGYPINNFNFLLIFSSFWVEVFGFCEQIRKIWWNLFEITCSYSPPFHLSWVVGSLCFFYLLVFWQLPEWTLLPWFHLNDLDSWAESQFGRRRMWACGCYFLGWACSRVFFCRSFYQLISLSFLHKFKIRVSNINIL